MAQMKNVSEFNKLRVQLFIEAVLNEGRLELIDELIAADFIGHIPGAAPEVTGPAGVRQLISSHRHAHRGLHVKIEDQIAEEDRVVTRWHAAVPPEPRAAFAVAGRAACHAGITITRLLAGKQVDSHTECAAGYYNAFTDGNGAPLDGATTPAYRLTFAKHQIPQADRFWSLTAYLPPGDTLVPNAARKYEVARFTPGLVTNPDGSITIYLQTTPPRAALRPNWLPIPRGPFDVLLRVYGPAGNTSPGAKHIPPKIQP